MRRADRGSRAGRRHRMAVRRARAASTGSRTGRCCRRRSRGAARRRPMLLGDARRPCVGPVDGDVHGDGPGGGDGRGDGRGSAGTCRARSDPATLRGRLAADGALLEPVDTTAPSGPGRADDRRCPPSGTAEPSAGPVAEAIRRHRLDRRAPPGGAAASGSWPSSTSSPTRGPGVRDHVRSPRGADLSRGGPGAPRGQARRPVPRRGGHGPAPPTSWSRGRRRGAEFAVPPLLDTGLVDTAGRSGLPVHPAAPSPRRRATPPGPRGRRSSSCSPRRRSGRRSCASSAARCRGRADPHRRDRRVERSGVPRRGRGGGRDRRRLTRAEPDARRALVAGPRGGRTDAPDDRPAFAGAPSSSPARPGWPPPPRAGSRPTAASCSSCPARRPPRGARGRAHRRRRRGLAAGTPPTCGTRPRSRPRSRRSMRSGGDSTPCTAWPASRAEVRRRAPPRGDARGLGDGDGGERAQPVPRRPRGRPPDARPGAGCGAGGGAPCS